MNRVSSWAWVAKFRAKLGHNWLNWFSQTTLSNAAWRCGRSVSRNKPPVCVLKPVALEVLIDQLSATQSATHLLVTAGRAAAAVKTVLEHKKRLQPAYLLPKLLLISYLPALTQQDYDHLLWACDLNFVRGEDSLVRAIWAGKPFIWQIYPQTDGAHHAKLDAFLDMMEAPASLKQTHLAWNADSNATETKVAKVTKDTQENARCWPALDLPLWAQSAQNLSNKLRSQDDLAASLIAFVEKNS